jgi:hypothetical protein
VKEISRIARLYKRSWECLESAQLANQRFMAMQRAHLHSAKQSEKSTAAENLWETRGDFRNRS